MGKEKVIYELLYWFHALYVAYSCMRGDFNFRGASFSSMDS
jgi:hypothetical protein